MILPVKSPLEVIWTTSSLDTWIVNISPLMYELFSYVIAAFN